MIYPLPKRLFVMAKDTSGSDDLYLYTSTTNPIRWRLLMTITGGAPGDFHAVLFSSNNLCIITTFDATAPSSYYISTDRGSSWNPLLIGAVIYCFGGNTEFNVYAASDDYLYKRIGTSFVLIGPFRVGFFTGLPISIFAYPSSIVIVQDEGVIYRSIDNGASWSQIASGLVAVNKAISIGNTILLFSSTHSVRSLDAGVTWSAPVELNPAALPGELLRDADQSGFVEGTIVASMDKTILVSTDLGLSWRLAASASEILHSLVHSFDYTAIAVSRVGSYFVARGYGESIDEVTFNLENTNIKPYSIMKIPAQSSAAFKSRLGGSGYFPFRCGESACGEYLLDIFRETVQVRKSTIGENVNG